MIIIEKRQSHIRKTALYLISTTFYSFEINAVLRLFRPQYYILIVSQTFFRKNVTKLQFESEILHPFYNSTSINSFIFSRLSFFNVDLIVTIGSHIVIFFIPSRISFIFLAATGAQLPFSINATVRF